MPAGYAAAIAAVAGLGGAALQSDAANKASGSQDKASKEALAQQQAQYNQTRADMAPWRESGQASLGQLGTLLGQERSGPAVYGNDPRYKAIYQAEWDRVDAELRKQYSGRGIDAGRAIDPINAETTMRGIEQRAAQQFEQQYPDAARSNTSDPAFGSLNRKFTLADFWSDPVTQASYQSGLDLGTQALNRSAGARGNLNSGAQLKALLRFGTDYTGQQAAGSQARYVGDQTNQFNRFASIAGLGQTSAAQTGQLGQASAQNLGQILTAQGNARGAAAIAQGNAWQGAANNIGNNYLQQQWMNKMFPTQQQNTGYNPNANYSGQYLGQDDYSLGYY